MGVSFKKETSLTAIEIANALSCIRKGDYSVRLPSLGNTKEDNSIVEQVNQLAETLQAKAKAKAEAEEPVQMTQKIREKIFRFCAFSAMVLPAITVVVPHLLGFYQPLILLIGALLSTISSTINLAIYLRRKNLRLACMVHVGIANLCYSIAVFSSGGIESHVVIFAPLVVVIAGLLAGAYVVVASATFISAQFLFIEILERFSIMSPPIPQTHGIIFLEIFTCLFTIAGIIWLYEHIRKKYEAIMSAMNAVLLKEKAHNDQIMHALDASAIVAITDVGGKIIRVNENFCRISGFSEAELIGNDHRLVNSGQHAKTFFAEIWRTIGSGKVWSGEIENRTKDGNPYFVQTVITPLTNDKGKIENFMAVRFDVTKKRELSRQLEEAQRVAKIGSWSYDIEGQRKFWSRQMFDLHGLDPNLPPPDNDQHHKCIHPDDRVHWQNQVNDCLQSGKPYKIRIRIVTKAHREVWLEDTAEAVTNREGKLIKVRGTSQDVTDLVIAEQQIIKEQIELRARQRFLDTVLTNIPMMIFVKDYRNELRFSLLNKASERNLGISSESMLGKCDYDFFPKEQADLITKKDQQVLAKGEILKVASEFIDTPQGKKILSTIKIPTFDEEGRPEFLIGISDDITDEVRMKELLDIERAKVIQASKLASLGEMSAGVAHEINNPLMIIAGTIRALPKFASKPAEFEERVQMINKSLERIQKIVSGLRKFSRTADSTEMKSHSICDIAREALVLTSMKAQQLSVTLELDLGTEQKIVCNEIEIEQVLVNLINNGIDAVKNCPEKSVKLSVQKDESHVVMEIRDSGPGILHEHREKIFQPFFTTKPVGEGTGLGLAIVKGILDDHKATIDLGIDAATTCFMIRFRIAKEETHVA